MKPILALSVLGLLFGFAGTCLSAGSKPYFPAPKVPGTLHVIHQGSMSPGEMLMVTTTQGVLAKREPLVFVTVNESYDAWLAGLEAKGVRTVLHDDAWDLMRSVAPMMPVKGYVLAEPGTPSVNAATMASGVLGVPVVLPEQEGRLGDLGFKRVLDARGRDAQWAFRTYKDKLNKRMLFQQDPAKPHLRDYAVFNGAAVFYDEPKAFEEELMSWVEPDSPLFGWGPGDESQHVNLGARHGLFTVPSDWALNLTALAPFREDAYRQKGIRGIVPSPDPAGTQAHYVAFVMTDGDNLQWTLGGMHHDDRWFGSGARGGFPMAWTIPPSMADLAGPAMTAYYGAALDDTFIAGVSGLGYMYPSSNPALDANLSNLGSFMGRIGTDIAAVMDLGSIRNKKVGDALAKYAAVGELKGAVYIDYSAYAGDKGAIRWFGGKPFVTARHAMWESDLSKLVRDLNGSSRDVTGSRAYSLVWVHAWSHTLDDVRWVIDRLDPGVRVVGIGEFMGKVIGNLKP